MAGDSSSEHELSSRDGAQRAETWRLLPSAEGIGVLLGEYGTTAAAVFLMARLDALRTAERTLLLLHPTPSMPPERVIALAESSRRPVHVVAPPAWRRDFGIRDLAQMSRSLRGVGHWYEDGKLAIEHALDAMAAHEVVALLWPIAGAGEAWQHARAVLRQRARVLVGGAAERTST